MSMLRPNSPAATGNLGSVDTRRFQPELLLAAAALASCAHQPEVASPPTSHAPTEHLDKVLAINESMLELHAHAPGSSIQRHAVSEFLGDGPIEGVDDHTAIFHASDGDVVLRASDLGTIGCRFLTRNGQTDVVVFYMLAERTSNPTEFGCFSDPQGGHRLDVRITLDGDPGTMPASRFSGSVDQFVGPG